MFEMNVEGVMLDGIKGQPLLILSDLPRRRALPISIGPLEAASIGGALQGQSAVRPSTHDLMSTIIEEAGYRVDHVEITDLKSETYIATLLLSPRDAESLTLESKSIDCRPSDGIAVALRAKAPIMVSSTVFESSTIPILIESGPNEDEEFNKFVQDLKPGDFDKYLLESCDSAIEDPADETPDEESSGPASAD